MDRMRACGVCDVGSIPTEGTNTELNDFEEDKEWALLRRYYK
jgi:hypothetical protein